MSYPNAYKSALFAALDTLDLAKVEQAIDAFRVARDEGRTIFVFGNGGSAATANHFVCDVIKGCSYGCDKRFKMMALSEMLPTMTAYANDVGYDAVFVEPLRNFAKPGDIVMAISGSGNSPNVVRAIEYANEIDCLTIGLTGFDGGKLGRLAKLQIHVDDRHMGRAEDGHMIVCHMICYAFMDGAVA
ncbi:MAG: SIS domain-containing protein [Acidobacteria bacterium]|nr:SIS domain-containing protein [Acidobacteriota bacterium]